MKEEKAAGKSPKKALPVLDIISQFFPKQKTQYIPESDTVRIRTNSDGIYSLTSKRAWYDNTLETMPLSHYLFTWQPDTSSKIYSVVLQFSDEENLTNWEMAAQVTCNYEWAKEIIKRVAIALEKKNNSKKKYEEKPGLNHLCYLIRHTISYAKLILKDDPSQKQKKCTRAEIEKYEGEFISMSIKFIAERRKQEKPFTLAGKLEHQKVTFHTLSYCTALMRENTQTTLTNLLVNEDNIYLDL